MRHGGSLLTVQIGQNGIRRHKSMLLALHAARLPSTVRQGYAVFDRPAVACYQREIDDSRLRAQQEERAATADAVVSSTAAKRLVVAGPGTGKSTVFQRAFRGVGNSGVALTFINPLAKVLRQDLPSSVRVDTFHGYCFWLYKSRGNPGRMYRSLIELISDDLSRMRRKRIGRQSVEWAFHDLNKADNLIADSIARSQDYDAVSFPGIVHRMLETFQATPASVPPYPLVVVDEVQDFTRLEVALLGELAIASPILIAGDDDQFLYPFRHASPDYLHALWASSDISRFTLPYCSRCTAVVVDAVGDVIRLAQTRGLLAGRIEKRFECYLPTKAEDSARYPTLIHARIPRQTAANEVGRYIVESIAQIPASDIADSVRGGYPTALVIGTDPFLEYAEQAVKTTYPQAVVTRSREGAFDVDPLDGYRFVAAEPDSRLGWRILLYCFYKFEASERLDQALQSGSDFLAAIPNSFRTENEPFVLIVRKLMSGSEISEEERRSLEQRLRRTVSEIVARVAPAVSPSDADDGPPERSAETNGGGGQLSITCATLLGAKGLSGGHVFVVGCVDGFLPARPDTIQNDEVCQFIVALSRTRKQCHLISTDVFVGRSWRPSTFLSWISQPIELRHFAGVGGPAA